MSTHPTTVFRNALREEAQRRHELAQKHRALAVDLVLTVATLALVLWLSVTP